MPSTGHPHGVEPIGPSSAIAYSSLTAPLHVRPLDAARAHRLEQRQGESETRVGAVSRDPDTFERSAPAISSDTPTNTGSDTNARGEALSDQEQRKLDQMRTRDQEVRTHEQAHGAGAGGLARGGPNYTLTLGPDGKRYATGGHMNIDTSEAGTPEQTIQKAAQIRRSALAPADPSSKDRQVAAKASQMEAKARRELGEARASQADASESPLPESPAKQVTPRTPIDTFA